MTFIGTADLGRRIIEAWNSRDLERILALYDDAAELVSTGIVKFGVDPSASVKGKPAIRAYWASALAAPDLFNATLVDVSVSPDSVILRYVTHKGVTLNAYLRFNAAGLIVQSSTNVLI